jgi:hypothetical protein
MTMTLQHRQQIERQIIERIVKDALDAGFQITVDDGGEEPSVRRSDTAAADPDNYPSAHSATVH